MSDNLEIQSKSSIDVNDLDIVSSDKEDSGKNADGKDAEESDLSGLTTSQLRKLRRGRKTKRTGKKKPRRKKKHDNNILFQKDDILILGNLPLLWTVEAVVSLLKQTTGFSKDNSCFYVEISKQPEEHVEALIQFLNDEHLFQAYKTLQAIPYPFTVEMQNKKSHGRRIPHGFLERSQTNMALMNKIHSVRDGLLRENTDNTQGDRNSTNAIESSNKPGEGEQPVDRLQGKSSSTDSNSENTHSKIRDESSKNDMREKYSVKLPPPPVIGIKSDAADDGESDDSTETVILKQEPAGSTDLDEIATAPLERVAANNELLIKQEPDTQFLINTSINLPTVTNLKQEPQDIHESHEHVLRNAEIVNAIAESETAIDDLLNDLNYCDMEIKHESVDTHDDNSKEIDQTKNDAYTITNDKQSSNISPIENSSKPVENHEVIETPTNNEDEIIWEISNTADQTVRNEEILNNNGISNNASQPSNHTYQLNKCTGPVVNDIETRVSPNHVSSESDANNCTIVHIKNVPVPSGTNEKRMLKFIRKVILEQLRLVYEKPVPVEICVLQNEIDHTLLREALVKFTTHIEALRACELLNGTQIHGETIEVKLDIGPRIVNENSNSTDCQSTTECLKRQRDDDTQDEDEPQSKERRKKLKKERKKNIEKMWIKGKCMLPTVQNSDTYGFPPHFLKYLGLPPQLTNVIYVKKLHDCVNEEKLREVFSMAGHIISLKLNKNLREARIEYDHPVEAVQAFKMFKNQKLYENEIIMHMGPVIMRSLPEGLSGTQFGFGRFGEPLRNLRTIIELKTIHEVLYELGKMNKFENKRLTAPFNVWYEKRTNDEPSTRHNPSSFTSVTHKVVTPSHVVTPSSINNVPKEPCQNSESYNSGTIEVLGAVLKSRGVIPADTDCTNAKKILAALEVDLQNHPSYASSNSFTTTTSPLNNMYVPNAVNDIAYLTQNFAHPPPTHNNVQQSFALGGPSNATQSFAQGRPTHNNATQSFTQGGPTHSNLLQSFGQAGPSNATQSFAQVGPIHSNATQGFAQGGPSNATQSFAQVGPIHSNATQGFAQGGPSNATQSFAQVGPIHSNATQGLTNITQSFSGVQKPMAKPNPTTISPTTLNPTLNWELSSNFPAHQNISNCRNEEAKRQEDYPRDPRVANKVKEPVFEPREEGGKVIFKNLPPSINQTALCEKMCTVGEVLYCKVAASTAIVAFKTSRDAERCFHLFNRSVVDGKIIEVICVELKLKN